MKNKNLNIITLLSALMLLLPSLCKSHEIKEDTIEKIIQEFIVNNPDLIQSSLDNHKINLEKQKIKKAINACKKYNAVILDKTKKSNVIQITALRRDIDKMAKNLKKFGLVSVSRTGAVAMTRGDKVFN
mgnify:CR=1 FL=1